MNRLFLVTALVFLFRAVCYSLADLDSIPPDMALTVRASEWSSFIVIIGLWWSHQVHKTMRKR